MNDIEIKIGNYQELGTDAHKVRDEVFCVEQGIDYDIERDEYDEVATHSVVYENKIPVAAGRLVKKKSDYNLGRIATLKEYRGKGYGKMVTKFLMLWAYDNSITVLDLHAQKSAVSFYEKLGFIPCGQPFSEAGIEHRSMSIVITPKVKEL